MKAILKFHISLVVLLVSTICFENVIAQPTIEEGDVSENISVFNMGSISSFFTITITEKSDRAFGWSTTDYDNSIEITAPSGFYFLVTNNLGDTPTILSGTGADLTIDSEDLKYDSISDANEAKALHTSASSTTLALSSKLSFIFHTVGTSTQDVITISNLKLVPSGLVDGTAPVPPTATEAHFTGSLWKRDADLKWVEHPFNFYDDNYGINIPQFDFWSTDNQDERIYCEGSDEGRSREKV